MKSFEKYFMNIKYARVNQFGHKLAEIDPLIDWEVFRPIIREMYDNHTERGGRPNNDEIVMMKMLVLQSWYGLSDPELERQAKVHISFHKFLGFPEIIPDRSTVKAYSAIKETIKTKRYRKTERLIDSKGLKIKEGVIQDATFITADQPTKRFMNLREFRGKNQAKQRRHLDQKRGKSH
ncbi:transposase [Methanobacterium sp. SMA-27]|uniref:transposase n=1 Tax=Methanobacterium sp. SMA-27 TaxID=1495336 RepID=UPI0009E02FC7|nr:transposase [Methanobacterium sp. SMA-27]